MRGYLSLWLYLELWERRRARRRRQARIRELMIDLADLDRELRGAA